MCGRMCLPGFTVTLRLKELFVDGKADPIVADRMVMKRRIVILFTICLVLIIFNLPCLDSNLL